MFGGLAFLVGGSNDRASGADCWCAWTIPAALVAESGERRGDADAPSVLRVDAEDVKTRKALSAWVRHGVTFARTLPPK